MKQLPERYAKIWQYMTDSNMPINNNRIAGLLQELFVSRLAATKGMLKNNIKTMKIRDNFDLRNDSWMPAVVAHWEHVALPELVEEVIDIKQTPDIKDRSVKMRNFLAGANASTSPMNILQLMEEDYRGNKESLHDPILEDVPDEYLDDDSPGFLRRAGGLAGRGAKGALGAVGSVAAMGAGAVGMSLMQHTKVLGGIVKGGMMAAGVAKVAYGGFKRAASAGSSTGRLGSSIKSLFGVGKTPVRARPQHDFTPREEELEGGGVKDVLERIEANTAALLEKFGGKPGDGKGGGLLSGLSGLISGLGSSLVSILKGPAMLAAVAALGTALAVAFGDKALEVLCKKFPSLCDKGLDIHEDDKFYLEQNKNMSKWESEAREAVKNGTATPYQQKIVKEIDEKNSSLLGRMGTAGSLTKSIESGSPEGNYGIVNPNDVGKASYGAYQFRADEGGLPSYMKFIENDSRYKPIADAFYKTDAQGQRVKISPGTQEFNTAWEGLAKNEATKDLFKESQDKVFQKDYHDPAIKFLKDNGFNSASPVLREVAAQLFVVRGEGGGKKVLREIKKNNNIREMSDQQIANAILNQMKGWASKDRIDKTKNYIDAFSAAPNLGFTPNSSVKSPASTPDFSSTTKTEEYPKTVDYTASEQAKIDAALARYNASIEPKAVAPKAPSLTAPTSPSSSSEGKGNTTVINNVPQQQGGGSKTRPSHRSPDVSIEKQLMEDKIHSSTR